MQLDGPGGPLLSFQLSQRGVHLSAAPLLGTTCHISALGRETVHLTQLWPHRTAHSIPKASKDVGLSPTGKLMALSLSGPETPPLCWKGGNRRREPFYNAYLLLA